MKQFIDDYFADEYGNVYSRKYGKLKKLKPYTSKQGYNLFTLSVNKKIIHFSQHHVSYWVNVSKFDTSDGLQIDHIDGDKQNNHYSNLRRVSPKENMNNSSTHKKLLGKTPNNKIVLDKDELTRLYHSGMSQRKMAIHFGCSRPTLKRNLSSLNLV